MEILTINNLLSSQTCSGFKCVAQHYCVLINELFSKMSRETLSLCYCGSSSAFYRHHPHVSTTFIQLFMSTQINNKLLISVRSVIRRENTTFSLQHILNMLWSVCSVGSILMIRYYFWKDIDINRNHNIFTLASQLHQFKSNVSSEDLLLTD